MSRARETAELGGIPPGRRNLIINGAMQVAQRGTSASPATLFQYNTADRIRLSQSGATSEVVNQEIVDDQDVGDFIGKALKTTVATASTSGGSVGFNYRVEDLDIKHLKNKQATLSWYAKADQAVDVFPFVFVGLTNLAGETVTLSTTWQRYTLTFTVTDVSSYMDILIRQDAGVTTSTYITGVQLEVGSVATEFEHRSYGEELALCQRYYTKFNFPQTTPFFFSHRQTIDTVRSSVITPVPMRTTPSINGSGQPTIRYYWDSASSILDSSGTSLTVIGDSLDANRFVVSNPNVTGAGGNVGSVFAYFGYLECSAEL